MQSHPTTLYLENGHPTNMPALACVCIPDLESSHSRLNQGHTELTSQQRECSKLERANRKLREELHRLQEHLTQDTVSRASMDAYKKEVDDRVCMSVA